MCGSKISPCKIIPTIISNAPHLPRMHITCLVWSIAHLPSIANQYKMLALWVNPVSSFLIRWQIPMDLMDKLRPISWVNFLPSWQYIAYDTLGTSTLVTRSLLLQPYCLCLDVPFSRDTHSWSEGGGVWCGVQELLMACAQLCVMCVCFFFHITLQRHRHSTILCQKNAEN